jgi:putative membrane protein
VGLLWRTLINAAAIVAAAFLVQPDGFVDTLVGPLGIGIGTGIRWGLVDYGAGEVGRYLSLALTALVLGLVNAIVRPILVIISFPITCATLGLFLLVINALMLLLVGAIPPLGFSVDGFWAALFGSIVISIVSAILSRVLPD